MKTRYGNDPTMDPAGFVLLADYVPHIVQEIRYYSTYNFIGERIDGYDEPCRDEEVARVLVGGYLAEPNVFVEIMFDDGGDT